MPVASRRENHSALFLKKDVGEVVGSNGDDLVAVYPLGDVSGGVKVGGLTGFSEEGTVRAAHSAGQVEGQSELGGLAGRNAPDYEGDIVILQDSAWDV